MGNGIEFMVPRMPYDDVKAIKLDMISNDSKTKITPISRDNLGVLTDYKHN